MVVLEAIIFLQFNFTATKGVRNLEGVFGFKGVEEGAVGLLEECVVENDQDVVAKSDVDGCG
jgi:hypothetical protein